MYRNTGGTQRTRARARLQHSIAHKSSKFIGVKVHIGNLSVMVTHLTRNRLVIKPGTEWNETKRNGKDRQKCGLWSLV